MVKSAEKGCSSGNVGISDAPLYRLPDDAVDDVAGGYGEGAVVGVVDFRVRVDPEEVEHRGGQVFWSGGVAGRLGTIFIAGPVDIAALHSAAGQ